MTLWLTDTPAADPDRSNPTRSRWERPLDTIRSFEAAIDGGSSRKSFIRSGTRTESTPQAAMREVNTDSGHTETESVANWNRRSSYYGSEFALPFPLPL